MPRAKTQFDVMPEGEVDQEISKFLGLETPVAASKLLLTAISAAYKLADFDHKVSVNIYMTRQPYSGNRDHRISVRTESGWFEEQTHNLGEFADRICRCVLEVEHYRQIKLQNAEAMANE